MTRLLIVLVALAFVAGALSLSRKQPTGTEHWAPNAYEQRAIDILKAVE